MVRPHFEPVRPSALIVALVMVCATGCGRSDRKSLPEAPAPAVSQPAAPADSVVLPKPTASGRPPVESTRSAAELYAECEARVEGRSVPGECQSDADCQTAGCSGELCISKQEAALGPMSTCEVRPCFAVLQACGCQEGTCRWSVGD